MTQQLSILRHKARNAAWMALVALSFAASFTALGNTASAALTPTASAHVKALAMGARPSSTAKLRDPRRNVTAAPSYIDFCAVKGPNSQSCLTKALQAINNARAAEGVKPMVLPANYLRLSIARQTFVVTNLERVDRGLRPIKGLTARLNANAQHAAVVRTDPTLVGSIMPLLGVREYGSIWAGDFGPLASDYDWMYNDGYSPSGSINLDCNTPSARGCWGHRHVILDGYSGLPTLISGVGAAKPVGSSIAQIFVGSTKSAFTYVYTWKQALAAGADGHKITAAQAGTRAA